ncbi:hypothetical protein [Pseudogemmobacter sonorensis]|uniref:hypothetical protein n=1 Tax=Pseudogemmobacter sonorensis TaxID=2989681 RepID=UPI0036B82E66
MAGITLDEALHLATVAPARLLGLDGLRPGAEADAILFDAPDEGGALRIRETWIGGSLAYADPGGAA